MKVNIVSRQVVAVIWVALMPLFLFACKKTDALLSDVLVEPASPLSTSYTVADVLVKKVVFDINNPEPYASISLYANDQLIIDRLNVPKAGQQELTALVRFTDAGPVTLKLVSNNAALTINRFIIEDKQGLQIPTFNDISVQVGMDKESSLKYAGPTIADMDHDGDYDFIVNNHNDASSKLYWNNGNGTVSKHNKNLARWFMHDLHGTAAGDYDNDGDLDLVVTQGGGNGTNPSRANFYNNNDGTLVLMTGDVGIDRGGRGRGAKWSDMDLDGDLDLMLINETSLRGDKPQHFFHENLGDGTFKHREIAGLQDQEPSRALITDINNDNIDDLILYGPLSVWLGNGDFTFTDVTSSLPTSAVGLGHIMAVTDLDIDNDGDLDLYIARGKEFELGKGEAPFVDHDPLTKEFSIRPRGYKGVDEFEFVADASINLHKYYFLTQGLFRGKPYPIFLGAKKTSNIVASGDELLIEPEQARGWPEDISANGVYFGYLGEGRWKAALVRNGDLFWGYKFSLSGVSEVNLEFAPENRNIADILLRNDGAVFTDVSQQWNIPTGGNALGVTTGDFNNDSFQDLFVYRWGMIGGRISDYMLLNDGQGQFQTVTMHGANDVGGPGNGDMGQAFDFNLDGALDLLNGSEGGEWYLYGNAAAELGNYVLVNVGYSPKANVDAISAEVRVETEKGEYRKRVGSSGEVFSQSLLNIVHFGLGDAEKIKRIEVTWRNGERVVIRNKAVNQLYFTDRLDPSALQLEPSLLELRQGTALQINTLLTPSNADASLNWSSNNNALSVDQHGVVNAAGEVGDTAVISAVSHANGLTATSQVSIVPWFSVPLQSVVLRGEHVPATLIAGQSLLLHAETLPVHADDTRLQWQSSDSNVAVVNAEGEVSALSAGVVTISVLSTANPTLRDEIALTVVPLVEPFISIRGAQEIKDSALVAGDSLTIHVDYHAGSGNTVIVSDAGGVQFWLRHFQSEWIPEKDITFTDASVIKTESGQSSMTFQLDGLTPTADLPEGHFYLLRASFASSNGNMYESLIYPLNIVAEKTAQ